MSTETKIQLAELNKLSPIQIANDPNVKKKWVAIYNGKENAELAYEREKFHFLRLINENQSLKECTGLSLKGCILDVAVTGLSFKGGSQPHIYMIPRSFNVGTKESKKYEKRAILVVSPYGELLLRMNAKQIKYVDDPIIVYKDDYFDCGSDQNGKWVKYKAAETSDSNEIKAAFIRIIRPDNTVDYFWMNQRDIKRLAEYSEKQNFGKANALYTSNNGQIDTGFLKAKVIKHALKTYTDVKVNDLPLGEHTILETKDDERGALNTDEPEGLAEEPQDFIDAEEVTAETVTVQTDENDEEGGF